MDSREAAFLASQAERLACNTKQQLRKNNNDGGGGTSEPVSGVYTNNDQRNKYSTQFFTDFRKICSEFQNELDSLFRMSSSTITTKYNDEDAKSYYATAAKRNEGRLKLDIVQKNVRLLQNHVLSFTTSSSLSSNDDVGANNIKQDDIGDLLQSILQTPMGEITQTDMRLLSQEISKIMKCIDETREIICPKEKFIFKRYRAAMKKAGTGAAMNENSAGSIFVKEGNINNTNDGNAPIENETKDDAENLRSKYGGLVEKLSNCTVEISSDNTCFVADGVASNDILQYYASPRSIHALHPPSSSTHHTQHSKKDRESSSYLLQNLDNVTVVLHGSRPSLHLQHIRNCKIYITEPTLGAVHVTDAQCSILHCACYQLRVHDSKEVQFNVWTRSGPIIETCTDMVFMGSYYLERELASTNDSLGGISGTLEARRPAAVVGRNMFWDVKDFNWLRALRKSPNFVVVDTVVGTKEEKNVPEAKDVIVMENREEIATILAAGNDSEDEL